MKLLLHIIFLIVALRTYSQAGKQYFNSFIADEIFRSAHIGISVYDPSSKTYLHSYQSDKYFVPASNTKIFTCYAALKYLPDTVSIYANDTWWNELGPGWAWTDYEEVENYFPYAALPDSGTVWTGLLDSLLRPMMFKSDNYLAEQLLRTVSLQKINKVDQEIIIDTILNNAFRKNVSRPKWVDGCGLSRYNLFTPQQFVFILDKIWNEYGEARIKTIFPSGGNGTLKNYYMADKGFIFAKTGGLTGVIGLSGYVYTLKNKPLIFSILVNNYNGSATTVRKRIERFIKELRQLN